MNLINMLLDRVIQLALRSNSVTVLYNRESMFKIPNIQAYHIVFNSRIIESI